MHFNHSLLEKQSGLGTVWILATVGSQPSPTRATKKDIMEVPIPHTCSLVATTPMAMTLSANLMYGLVVLYRNQIEYHHREVQRTRTRIAHSRLCLALDRETPERVQRKRQSQLLEDDPAFHLEIQPQLDPSQLFLEGPQGLKRTRTGPQEHADLERSQLSEPNEPDLSPFNDDLLADLNLDLGAAYFSPPTLQPLDMDADFSIPSEATTRIEEMHEPVIVAGPSTVSQPQSSARRLRVAYDEVVILSTKQLREFTHNYLTAMAIQHSKRWWRAKVEVKLVMAEAELPLSPVLKLSRTPIPSTPVTSPFHELGSVSDYEVGRGDYSFRSLFSRSSFGSLDFPVEQPDFSLGGSPQRGVTATPSRPLSNYENGHGDSFGPYGRWLPLGTQARRSRASPDTWQRYPTVIAETPSPTLKPAPLNSATPLCSLELNALVRVPTVGSPLRFSQTLPPNPSRAEVAAGFASILRAASKGVLLLKPKVNHRPWDLLQPAQIRLYRLRT